MDAVIRNHPYHVLFLCTGNSARSILAEALLSQLGAGRFIAYSAGSTPAGQVNPYALATLELYGFAVQNPRSKRWDEFAFPDGRSQEMDFIITVCDSVVREICPVWPGHPVTAHWGVADPAAVEGSDVDKMQAFRYAFETLRGRVESLVALPLAELGHDSIKKRLDDIGISQPGW